MRRIATEVCILGAGPAGLGVASELARAGTESMVVLDRNDRIGGLARTESFDGNLFDVGPHRFFTKNAEVNALWHQTLGEDFRPVDRLTRIYYKHKLFRYPLEPTDALRRFGVAEAAHAVVSYAAAQFPPRREPQNFEQWVVNRFGQKLYETFFKTYTEKVWGIPCSEIGVDWATQRIKGLDLKTLARTMLTPGRASRPKSLVERFDYPRLGAGMMFERMAEQIESPTRQFLLGSTITAIHRDGNRITSVEALTPAGERLLVEAEQFFSSIPITKFFQLLTPAVDAELLRAAGDLYYRDHITVNMVVEGAEVFPDQWIYIHSPDVQMARVANYNNFSPEMAKEKGTTLLSVEYFVFQTDEIWAMGDEDLGAFARSELEHTGLVPRGRCGRSWVTRETESYPTYFIGYEAAFGQLKRRMDMLENCNPVGRGGMYRYNNMDHSLYTGILAARNYARPQVQKYDVWLVNTDAEYHEDAARDERVKVA